jgi:hypothetical protein
MIRMRSALVSISTAIIATSCSSTDANLGDGQEYIMGANRNGASGDSSPNPQGSTWPGHDGGGGAPGSGGSAGTAGSVNMGTGGTCNGGLGIACKIDAGTAGAGGSSGGPSCGGTTCSSTQRCCEVPGADQICSPVCTSGPCPAIACRIATDAGTTVDAGGPIEAGGALTWHATCGLPVCPADPPPLGLPACTTDEKAGAPCSTNGQQCDAMLGCGAKLECADHQLDKMCPISQRAAKQDIRYVTNDDLRRLAAEVEKIRLTTYTYKDPSRGSDEHLGFIIDDNPESAAVYPNHQRVDLYGYTSMAVATLQVQRQQIDTQQRQLDELQRELTALRAELRATRAASP